MSTCPTVLLCHIIRVIHTRLCHRCVTSVNNLPFSDCLETTPHRTVKNTNIHGAVMGSRVSHQVTLTDLKESIDTLMTKTDEDSILLHSMVSQVTVMSEKLTQMERQTPQLSSSPNTGEHNPVTSLEIVSEISQILSRIQSRNLMTLQDVSVRFSERVHQPREGTSNVEQSSSSVDSHLARSCSSRSGHTDPHLEQSSSSISEQSYSNLEHSSSSVSGQADSPLEHSSSIVSGPADSNLEQSSSSVSGQVDSHLEQSSPSLSGQMDSHLEQSSSGVSEQTDSHLDQKSPSRLGQNRRQSQLERSKDEERSKNQSVEAELTAIKASIEEIKDKLYQRNDNIGDTRTEIGADRRNKLLERIEKTIQDRLIDLSSSLSDVGILISNHAQAIIDQIMMETHIIHGILTRTRRLSGNKVFELFIYDFNQNIGTTKQYHSRAWFLDEMRTHIKAVARFSDTGMLQLWVVTGRNPYVMGLDPVEHFSAKVKASVLNVENYQSELVIGDKKIAFREGYFPWADGWYICNGEMFGEISCEEIQSEGFVTNAGHVVISLDIVSINKHNLSELVVFDTNSLSPDL